MKIFFSMPTDLYFTELEKEYRKVVENTFLLNDLNHNIIKFPSDYMDELNKATDGMKRRDRDKYITAFFLKKVEECDILVYVNTYTADGNVLFTRGVRGELNRALELGKIVYRLYLDFPWITYRAKTFLKIDGKGKLVELQKMDMTHFKTIADSYNYNVVEKEWVLKSVGDYIKFYENNPEAIELMKKQFESGVGTCVAIPHYNYVYQIEKYGTWKIRDCKRHKDHSKHSIILPKQELTKLCPYLEDKWIWADYSTVKLNPFPSGSDGDGGIIDLLKKTRTLHKLMYILKGEYGGEDRKCDYSKEGIAYINEDGKIPFERGKPVKDYRKIAGVRPLFDIDIKDEVKVVDAFFEDSIFNEYQKTIDLFFKYYENENENDIGGGSDRDVRCMFSGNGLYIDLGEHLFSDFDCKGFEEFDTEWRSIRKTMQEIMNENGIKRLQIEKGYGWNRYFKTVFSFHAKSERISIPMNINESLDKKWLKEVTDIRLGLEQNISNEIIMRSGNNWR